MTKKASSVIETGIFATDVKPFAIYLRNAGYKTFSLSVAGEFLHVYFGSPVEEMYYTLQDVETGFKKMYSNVYFYDLDDNIEDDIQDIFGEDDY